MVCRTQFDNFRQQAPQVAQYAGSASSTPPFSGAAGKAAHAQAYSPRAKQSSAFDSGLTILSVPGNELSGLPKLPTGLKALNVSGNNLTEIPNFPPHAWHASSIEKFEADLRGNLFSDKDLRTMHDRLKASESGSTKHAPLQFDAPPALPTAVMEAWISNAQPHEQASRMEAAIRIANAHETNAPSLKMLHASDNHLEKLGELPATLQVLTVAGNNLTSLPALPQALTGLNVKDNRLTQIPELPDAAWSKAEHTYFMADLRDNQFSAVDLRAFQARLDGIFKPDADARLRFRIEAPAPVE